MILLNQASQQENENLLLIILSTPFLGCSSGIELAMPAWPLFCKDIQGPCTLKTVSTVCGLRACRMMCSMEGSLGGLIYTEKVGRGSPRRRFFERTMDNPYNRLRLMLKDSATEELTQIMLQAPHLWAAELGNFELGFWSSSDELNIRA